MAEGSERLVAALGQWRSGRGPLFERLVSALVRASEQAALPAGGQLPAERVLARELEVSRSTVVAAYRELRERGVAVTRHGSGTVMRNVTPAAAGASAPAVAALLARSDLSAPLIDLSVGGPDFDDLVRDLTVSGSALPLRARSRLCPARLAGAARARRPTALAARSADLTRRGVNHQRWPRSDQPRGRPRGSGRATDRGRVARVSKRLGRDCARRRQGARHRA